jgi:hypothetical protein
MWNGDREFLTRKVRVEHVQDKGMKLMIEIFNAYNRFKIHYNEFGNNINVTEIFGNRSIMEEGRNLEELVFGVERYRQISNMIDGKLVGEMCNEDGNIRPKEELDRTLGIRMNWAEYFRLRAEVENLRLRFTREENCQIRELNLDNFMMGRKKGIKKYRWIIEGRHSSKYKESDPTVIASVITLWGEYRGDMGRTLIELNLGIWKIALLAPEFKNFLFKLVHGKLYLNAQLAHIDDIDPQCTFCSIKEKIELKRESIREGSNEYTRRLQALDRETINHLFWDCGLVRIVIKGFFNNIANSNDQNVIKDKYMGGWEEESRIRTKLILILVHFVKYYIYGCRAKRNVPSLPGLMYEYGGLLKNLTRNIKWCINVRDLIEIMSKILVR